LFYTARARFELPTKPSASPFRPGPHIPKVDIAISVGAQGRDRVRVRRAGQSPSLSPDAAGAEFDAEVEIIALAVGVRYVADAT